MNNLLTQRNRNKGFTLVEIIVVLVILAILAAIAVPSLIGYIDRAKETQVLTEARVVYVATQSVVSAQRVEDGTLTEDQLKARINDLIGETMVDHITTTGSIISVQPNSVKLQISLGKVSLFQYRGSDGTLVVLENGKLKKS